MGNPEYKGPMAVQDKTYDYIKKAEECLAGTWKKDQAQTYAILALVHKLDELHKTISKAKVY